MLRWLATMPAGALRRQVLGLEDVDWDADLHRQTAFAVHSQTRSIRLVWTDLAGWPDVEAAEQPAWAHFGPAVLPILHASARCFSGPVTLMNAVLARLDAGCAITPHVDAAPFFERCHRLHVPLLTNPRVAFQIGEETHHLKAGELYEVNNRHMHGVHNGGRVPRVHLILDFAPL